jgi:hypothetical protein
MSEFGLGDLVAAERGADAPVEKTVQSELGDLLVADRNDTEPTPEPEDVEPEPEKVEPAKEEPQVYVDADGNPATPKDVADYLKWKHLSKENEKRKNAALTENEKLTNELNELRETVQQLQRQTVISKVLSTHSLSPEAEEFLKGSTEAELNASAEKLVALFGKPKLGRPAKDKTPNALQAQREQPHRELTLGEIAVQG